MTATAGPHQGQPLEQRGAPLSQARAAMVMVHGRGASAQSILEIADALRVTDVAFLAPQAAGGTWYPNRFLAPIPTNEPGISSGIRAVGDAVSVATAAGIPPERVLLLGFSQGACLCLEFAARHARRYGGIAGLSGGLIGPDGTPRDYAGSFDGTPVFLGCSDVDTHIPAGRVLETAAVLRRMGAEVDLRLYPGMDHTVSLDELKAVRDMVERTTSGS
jgi:predicted esterase